MIEIHDEDRKFIPTEKHYYDASTGEMIIAETIDEAVAYMTNKYNTQPFDIIVGYYVSRKFKRG